jgi:Uri superfamily endonuclease
MVFIVTVQRLTDKYNILGERSAIMAVLQRQVGKSNLMRSSSSAPGSYILIVHLKRATIIKPGSLDEGLLPSGYYAYVGSAMGGLKPRLHRHLTKNKTPRWHIDYLTNKGSVSFVVVVESNLRLECRLAKALKSQFASVAHFGCSDCDCSSHLFFAPHEEEMKAGIERVLTLINCPSKVLGRNDVSRYLMLS